jgi:hypothetical protein
MNDTPGETSESRDKRNFLTNRRTKRISRSLSSAEFTRSSDMPNEYLCCEDFARSESHARRIFML